MTNDQMYKQYSKLVHKMVFKYPYKPKNWQEYREDVTSEVWLHLFNLPQHGTRRDNPAYVSVVTGNAIKSVFKSLNKTVQNEYLDINDFQSVSSLIDDNCFDDVDVKILIDDVIQNVLNVDEQIAVISHFGLNPMGKKYSIKAISKMIFQNRDNTQRILDRAKVKIENYLKTKGD